MRLKLVAWPMLVVTMAFSTNASAQFGKRASWHAKYQVGLGAELERNFGQLLGACGAQLLDRRNKNLSSVPRILQTTFEPVMDSSVAAMNGQSSAIVFRYVFPQASLAAFDSTDPSKQLSPSIFAMTDTPTPVAGMSSRIYSQNCASILSAALNLKFSPPSASIEGALNNQFRGNSSIALVQGTFYSPLYGLLTQTAEDSERLAALLAIWDYYSNNGLNPSQKFYYLSGFRGMALFFVSGRAMSQEYEVKASAGGNWLVASIDAKVDARLQQESRLTVNDYVTLVFKNASGTDDLAFRELPSPATVAIEFAQRTPVFRATNEEYLKQNAPFEHYFAMKGIPAALCQTNRWALANASNAAITYREARFVDGVCQFHAAYKAPDNLTQVPPVISYTIQSSATVGAERLAVNASFRPVTTDHPIATVADFEERPAKIRRPTGQEALQWSIPVQISDARDPVDFTLRPPSLSNTQLACEGTETGVSTDVKPAAGGVTISVERLLAGTDIIDPQRSRECTFTAALMVPLRPLGGNERNAVRPVRAQLQMPVLTPPSPPPPSPMPNP